MQLVLLWHDTRTNFTWQLNRNTDLFLVQAHLADQLSTLICTGVKRNTLVAGHAAHRKLVCERDTPITAKRAHTVTTVPSRLLIINKLKVHSTQNGITVQINGNPTGMSINVKFTWKMAVEPTVCLFLTFRKFQNKIKFPFHFFPTTFKERWKKCSVSLLE